MKKFSIVIPVYNEQDNIADLHKEIKDVCIKNNYIYEIILVNDGSVDNTQNVIELLNPANIIKFRRNFGQTAALDAGIKSAQYDYIITMDGDGQNDPADIPNLIDALYQKKVDIVSGWRKNRKDNFSKRFVSRSANILRKFFINDGINDSGCALKIYKKECFLGLNLYGEMHRFIPALLKIKGFKIGEIIVKHRERRCGKTKYTWHRMLKGFIDMTAIWFWHKYAVRPLHLLGGLGLGSIFLGSICSIITIYIYISKQDLSNTVWPILSAFLLLAGIQLFVSGLIADMVSKSYYDRQTERQKAQAELSAMSGKLSKY